MPHSPTGASLNCTPSPHLPSLCANFTPSPPLVRKPRAQPADLARLAPTRCHPPRMATAQLSFHALLETARTEALAVLCELMFPEPDTHPAQMRERRIAATTILRLDPTPGCHAQGGRPADRFGRASAQQTEPPSNNDPHTPSPSEEGRDASRGVSSGATRRGECDASSTPSEPHCRVPARRDSTGPPRAAPRAPH